MMWMLTLVYVLWLRYITVCRSDIRKEMQCPICLGMSDSTASSSCDKSLSFGPLRIGKCLIETVTF